MPENNNWKTITLVIGGAAGLITGVAAAFILIKRREQDDGTPLKFSSKEGAKIGVGVVNLLRSIAESSSK